MSEWFLDWCLFLLTVAVRVLVGVLAVEEEHRPKHALRDKTGNGAGVVRTGHFRVQGDDLRARPQSFSVRVG